MATKIKIDLIFQTNELPVYFDDKTKVDNVLSDFDITDLMVVLNAKNLDEFDIKLVSIDLSDNIASVFSTLFLNKNQVIKSWMFSEFPAPQQTVINDFIALL